MSKQKILRPGLMDELHGRLIDRSVRIEPLRYAARVV